MLQKILEILLGRHTVESALIHFNKALSKLEAVEKQESAEIERREQEIAEAIAAKEESLRHRARAIAKAAKIRSFIGDEDDLIGGAAPLRVVNG